MNVDQAVKEYVKTHGWPSEVVRIGPYTCGIGKGKKRCRAVHAYAVAELHVNHDGKHKMYVWGYERPCDGNGVEYRGVRPSRG